MTNVRKDDEDLIVKLRLECLDSPPEQLNTGYLGSQDAVISDPCHSLSFPASPAVSGHAFFRTANLT